MDGWNDFYVAQVGASAALVGLLFVAVSINLERILSGPNLPDRALVALSLLLGILVMSSLMLMPDQAGAAIGVEALVIGVVLASADLRLRPPGGDAKARINLILLGVAVLPYAVGGIIVLAGDLELGLYFIAASIVLSFLKAILDAWVLMVEINR